MKTTSRCPICDETFTRVHTADKPPKYCSRACANRAPGRITPEMRAAISERFQGEKHPNWISGSWVTPEGRTFVRVPPEERHLHPTVRRKDGYIRRYHYVWNINNPSDPVMPNEIIHHINHDKTDDRIENLRKWNQPEHARHHFLGTHSTPEARANMSRAQLARRQRERDLRQRLKLGEE